MWVRHVLGLYLATAYRSQPVSTKKQCHMHILSLAKNEFVVLTLKMIITSIAAFSFFICKTTHFKGAKNCQ